MLRAAKETISLAEQRLLEDDKRQFDSAWQEMLNHATQRVGVSAGRACVHSPACGRAGWACRGEGAGLAPASGSCDPACACLSDPRIPRWFP